MIHTQTGEGLASGTERKMECGNTGVLPSTQMGKGLWFDLIGSRTGRD